MATAGGSANINGVLYQTLTTLRRAAQIRISDFDAYGDDIRNARIVVEPSDGGDLQIVGADVKRVEQIKAKSTGGTWSLRDVVESVLPDLYLAVDNACKEPAEFLFTTEGRIGEWSEALAFFESLGHANSDTFTNEELNSDKRHKVGNRRLSDRELFEFVCQAVTNRKQFKNESQELTVRKVKFLLSRFSMSQPIKLETLITDINVFLTGHVDFADANEIDSKRRELCGILIEIAAIGDQTFTAEKILRKANLPIWSFKSSRRLQERMNTRLKSRLEKDQYFEELDVRPAQGNDRTITLFSGEGGQGKTWSLAKLASQKAESGILVGWVHAIRPDGDPIQIAADELWKHGLDRDRPLALDRIANLRKRVLGYEQGDAWALVCIDGVSKEELQIILRQDWNDWGINVAMTTTSEIANEIEAELDSSQFFCRFEVDDFSISQLNDYMSRRGDSWAETEDDVRRLIRRPILAKLYCDLTELSDNGLAKNEYELMNSYWKHIRKPVDSKTVDVGVVRKLASFILSDQIPPWPVEELVVEMGIPSDSIERLKRCGWLCDFGDGRVGFWHFRLRSWALAKSLVSELESRKRDLESLCAATKKCADDFRRHGHFNVGYTPLDVLWLLLNSERQAGNCPSCWKIIKSIELYGGTGREDEWLYELSLPSLGIKAIPHLFDRARNIEHGRETSLGELIFNSMKRITSQPDANIKDATKEFLNSTNETQIELGLRLVGGYPEIAEPNLVWRVHCNHLRSEKDDRNFGLRSRLTASALDAVCSYNLEWLEEKLANGTDQAPHLIASLSAVESIEAENIWNRHKKRLMSDAKNRFAIISCILNFRDMEELDTIESWIGEDIDAKLVQTFLCLAPERALSVFPNLDPTQFSFRESTISLGMFSSMSVELVNPVLRHVATGKLDTYFRFFVHVGDRLEPATISCLVEWLDQKLKRNLNNKDRESRLFQPLSLVANLHGQNVLETFRSFRDTGFETRLREFAESRADDLAMAHDSEFEDAINILKKICGHGIPLLANRLLKSPSQHAKKYGCGLALVKSDIRTAGLLEEVAMSESRWPGMAVGEFAYLQWEATEALIANEFNSGFVRALLKLGDPIPNDASDLRYELPPMTDDEIQPALDVLADENTSPMNAIFAIGFSGRRELLHLIRSRLLASELDSKVAHCCLLAFKELGKECEQIMERLVRQYKSGHYKYLVLLILDNCEDAKPEHYLQLLPEADYDRLDLDVLRYLANEETTKEQVRNQVRKHILFQENFGTFSGQLVDRLIDLDIEDERNLLWEHSAAPSGSFFNGDKATAIERLASIDQSSAYELALSELSRDKSMASKMPTVLLKLKPSVAVEDLFTFATETKSKLVLRAIGLALRRYADDEAISDSLASSLYEADWKTRRSVAFICGYLPNSKVEKQLSKLAFGDRNMTVAHMAQSSIRMHQKEDGAKRIIEKIDFEQKEQIWAAIEDIVKLVDPAILVMKSDPIGFLNIFKRLPFCFARHANRLVEKRAKEIESKLDSITNQWSD